MLFVLLLDHFHYSFYASGKQQNLNTNTVSRKCYNASASFNVGVDTVEIPVLVVTLYTAVLHTYVSAEIQRWFKNRW